VTSAVRIVLGLLLLATAVVVAIVEIVAIVDPVGTAAANDADPFGPPAPWHSHIIPVALIAVMGWASLRLLWRRNALSRQGLR